MKKNLMSTKDVIAGYFLQPFCTVNEAAGKRDWGYAIATEFKNPEPKINPLDMQLWNLGTFDDETGEIVSDVHLVAQAIEFKKEKPDGIQKSDK